ncbi:MULTISPECIES: 4Fe-4S single cluster domain-containing protein [Frankia]|nr:MULTISPECIES: 4Fe-4S single cluster domain-containing protein [Frankia]
MISPEPPSPAPSDPGPSGPGPSGPGVSGAEPGLGPSGATLRMSRRHFPVTSLGPGIRAGLWVQGCTIGCPGCMSLDTWDPAGGSTTPIAELLAWLCERPGLTGVTISGGEPFQQPEPLGALLRGLRAQLPAVDVLVYSGYTTAALRRSPRRAAAMQWCDVVVTGPYVARRAPGGAWRGSANQRLEILTPLGRERFGAVGEGAGAARPLQVGLDDGRWWLIGVPAPGDLNRIEQALARRGVELADVSWRPRP